jgi:N-acetylglucosaminyldiphosphoundecaprenol N-acetyl-beta-D-mannosaminyltransferase
MSITEDRSAMDTFSLLGVPIAVATTQDVVGYVNHWIAHPTRSRLVTFTNVHMVVEASLHAPFKRILNAMDLNCPDGFPIFWLTNQQFGERVQKVSGPDFMETFCQQSVALGHRHFLYGGAPGVAQQTANALEERYDGIQIAGIYSPPYRLLSGEENEEMARTIEESGAHVVWVCLGCPKQEKWIADMRDLLPGKVILAVGQAFDLLAGRTHRSPEILSRHGGEWIYRLIKEPRRLWKRYLVTNMLFVALLAREKLSRKPIHIPHRLLDKD